MQNNFVGNKTILVTGANGQLGSELQQLAPHYPDYQFQFTTKIHQLLSIDIPHWKASLQKCLSALL